MVVPSSRTNPPLGLKVATVTVAFVFLLTFRSFKSVSAAQEVSLAERKMVLGSKPPGCANKCLSCRPCKATLVIPSHLQKIKKGLKASSSSSSHDEEDTYYLLSWKCKCGNRLFQP